jgi:hypothetical protein
MSTKPERIIRVWPNTNEPYRYNIDISCAVPKGDRDRLIEHISRFNYKTLTRDSTLNVSLSTDLFASHKLFHRENASKSETDTLVTKAMVLGYNFATDVDRKAYEDGNCSFRLTPWV